MKKFFKYMTYGDLAAAMDTTLPNYDPDSNAQPCIISTTNECNHEDNMAILEVECAYVKLDYTMEAAICALTFPRDVYKDLLAGDLLLYALYDEDKNDVPLRFAICEDDYHDFDGYQTMPPDEGISEDKMAVALDLRDVYIDDDFRNAVTGANQKPYEYRGILIKEEDDLVHIAFSYMNNFSSTAVPVGNGISISIG